MVKLNEYLKTNFPGITLKPNLYYQWDIGIHLTFANELYQFKNGKRDELNPDYFKQVYNQALTIFNEIFSAKDEIFLVTNTYYQQTYRNSAIQKIKVYNKYIKNKDLCFHLKQETLPYVFDDEEETEKSYTSRFSLKCSKTDIRYTSLIKAVCNEDFSLKPRLGDRFLIDYPDVFFINITKGVIYFIYDDRGCEVIARNKETIRPLYEKYYDWLDDYTKEDANKLFK